MVRVEGEEIVNMTYSKSGIGLTEQFEGCRLTAYEDIGGVWTIGYGHTAGVLQCMTITQAQAEEFLTQDIAWAVSFVNKSLTVNVTQAEFDALVDFTFNLGRVNLAHSQLLNLINKGDFADAADEFEKWDHNGGLVVAGLLRRRLAEEKEFQS